MSAKGSALVVFLWGGNSCARLGRGSTLGILVSNSDVVFASLNCSDNIAGFKAALNEFWQLLGSGASC